MAGKDYVPKREDLLVAFFANLAAKIAAYATLFGLLPARVSQVIADSTFVAAVLNSVAASKADTKEWVDLKDLILYGDIGSVAPPIPSGPAVIAISPVAPGVIQRLRDLGNYLKNHPSYTTSIGEDLGLIAPAAAAIPGDAQPTGKATAQGNFQALIEWVKGRFDGVDIETQLAGESTWTYLAFDSFSPYLDTRPPAVAGRPEVRRYRMRYRNKENPVGVWSDVIEVLVGA